jgi:hypothetical protein
MSYDDIYFAKYMKYKTKYLELSAIYGGAAGATVPITAAEAEKLFNAFDSDKNGNLASSELIAQKDGGNLSLEKMVANYAKRLQGVDNALITKFVRAVSGGSKNFTPTSTDAFNKQSKLLGLAGDKKKFVAGLMGLKLL